MTRGDEAFLRLFAPFCRPEVAKGKIAEYPGRKGLGKRTKISCVLLVMIACSSAVGVRMRVVSLQRQKGRKVMREMVLQNNIDKRVLAQFPFLYAYRRGQ